MKRLVILAAFLAGCSTTPPAIDVTVACPPLTTWTVGDQAALAATLAPVPGDSVLWRLERDWQSTRDAIRACRSTQPKP